MVEAFDDDSISFLLGNTMFDEVVVNLGCWTLENS
jgi:hypothetical protein